MESLNVPVREVDKLVNLPHPDHPLRQLHDLSIPVLDPEKGAMKQAGAIEKEEHVARRLARSTSFSRSSKDWLGGLGRQ